MNERLKTILVLIALTPFLAGGGGFSGSGFTTILPAAVNAEIVMDPHNNLVDNPGAAPTTVTPTGRRASIRVTRGGASASAFFTVPPLFAFDTSGCNVTPAVMDQRFVSVPNLRHVPMDVWIPGPLAESLLTAVGLTGVATGAFNATITSVDHASCTPDAGQPAGVVGPGILSFHARIHLVSN